MDKINIKDLPSDLKELRDKIVESPKKYINSNGIQVEIDANENGCSLSVKRGTQVSTVNGRTIEDCIAEIFSMELWHAALSQPQEKFMLLANDSTHPPKHIHSTFELANQEANRLCLALKTEVKILQIVGEVVLMPTLKTATHEPTQKN